MAQVNSVSPGRVQCNNLAVSVVQTGLTDLLEFNVDGIAEVGISIDVTVQALDAFSISGRMSPATAYQVLYNLAGDFTTPAGAVIDASGDLTTQAAASSGWVLLNVLGLYSLKVQASGGNATPSVVDAAAMGKGAWL